MKKRTLVYALLAALMLQLCACGENAQQPTATNDIVSSQPTSTAGQTEPGQTESAPTEPSVTEPVVTEPAEHFEFEKLDDGTYRITAYLLDEADQVVIPATYNGAKIVEIADYAFNRVEVKSVTIPKHIAQISGVAFQTCEIESFRVDADNPYFCAVEGVLFSKDQTTLVRFPTSAASTSYTVPEGVKTIAFAAFSNCSNLESVNLPVSLREINTMAFSYCYNLSGIELPDGLESIGDGAFFGVELMIQLYIPASVNSIGEKPCGNCDSLMHITVDEQNVDYQSIDGVLFDKAGTVLIDFPCGLAGLYEVPESVREIARESFDNCNVTEVILPSGLQKIGGLAFQGGADLAVIRFTGTMAQWSEVELGYACFSGCAAAQITCSDGMADIPED